MEDNNFGITVEKPLYTVEAPPEPVMIPSSEFDDPGRNPLCVNSPYHATHFGQPCPITIN